MSRRTRRLTRTLLLTVLVVSLATAVFAEEPVCYQTSVDAEGNPTGPLYCTQQVWFADSGTKAGNAAAAGGGSYPTWDTTAPTTSVQGGAGGGFLTTGVGRQMASDPQTDAATGATFNGQFTGALDNMMVDMFLFAPATAAADPAGAYVGSLEMDIDGQQVLMPSQVNLVLEPAGDAVLKARFAITDLQAALDYAELDSGPDVVHDIRFFFSAYGLVSATGVVVYDTTEVPGGITFNAAPLPEGLVTVSAG